MLCRNADLHKCSVVECSNEKCPIKDTRLAILAVYALI